MNAFADVQLRNALFRIDVAILELEEMATGEEARRNLQIAKGQLHAMRQLLDMEADLAEAKTLPATPVLRVVK